jgi:2',3'-cyclic-nucleotide 2'-phosphodiesterase
LVNFPVPVEVENAAARLSPPKTSAYTHFMRILLLGDLVGRSGREAALKHIPELRASLRLDFVMVNAENASHGFGLGPDMAEALFAAGADMLTLGNHAWDRREIVPYIATEKRLIRPLNYPPGTPGAGAHLARLPDGRKVLVAQAMGRLFMDPMDCPFRAMEDLLTRHKLGMTTHAILLDIHAEASSEKMSFGHAFDGRVSAVAGTHTHVPTADHQVLPGGTAYVSDLGMCGDYDSVIGMQKAAAIGRFVRKMPGEKLSPAEGPATLCGAFVETDDATGLAHRMEPVRLGGRLAQVMPSL